MIQHLVHIEKVSMMGQQIQFQIKIPRDVKRICSIHQTTTARLETQEDLTITAPEVGDLWLRYGHRVDVFYSATLKTAIDHYHEINEAYYPIRPFGKQRFWCSGKKTTFINLPIELSTNIIEGFYADHLQSNAQQYELRIYLTIER